MEQISLTDAELERIAGQFLDAHPHAQWDSDMMFRHIDKAQLKKVVEFIQGVTANAAAQAYKDDLILALLKEVE